MENKDFVIFADGMHPFSMGGMQSHTTNLIANVLPLVSSVSVFLPLPKGEPSRVEDVKNLYASDLQKKLNIYEVERPNLSKLPLLGYILEEWIVSKRYCKLLKNLNRRPNLIYAQGFTGWAAAKNGYAVASHMHGIEFWQVQFGFINKIKAAWLAFFAKNLFKHSKLVISLGGKITNILVKNGLPNDKIFVHKNGFESVSLENLEKEKNSFLFVGRNEFRKGINDLLQVWEDNKLEYKLRVVGDIPKKNINNVEFLGKITDKMELAQQYKKAEFVIVPSYAEGMPMVLLEATKYNCIAITSNVGAISEYFNNTNSILIEAGNLKSILTGISNAIEHTAEQKTLKLSVLQKCANENLEKSIVEEVVAHLNF